ncbi:chromosome segregation ATPase [Gloeocapsopsis dulcis]|uniref:Chromosome segregation ATPase n=1 Tax=Gloeocapsopsis dulcis AAB1 = 1H9 TaxID=1433147 RepID=A0A6N8G6J5_9CHRO|nr:chromosome segregation ATPase [Gloeocapsopsis dulcis]MUL39477.1 chromosome segregation ATPase [Gloeocapsopsis dulcis AAB1 = 1H9]WNN90918.1 chromosome segregation ATPase [Gloeocapsopsis dulcis]
MREQGIPEDWSVVNASSQEDASQSLTPVAGIGSTDVGHTAKKGGNTSAPQPKPPKRLNPKHKVRLWSKNWVFWMGLGSLVTSGVGIVALAMLLKSPASPNCPAIFWPLASASVRLHCAQVAANKQTAQDLLQAIALVEALPDDHPLRPEINRLLEQWSLDILALAEQDFQAGRLEQAIATARKISRNVPAYQNVDSKIANWQSIWSEAEAIYAEVEDRLRAREWHQAFMGTVRLLNVGNEYWATAKYTELNQKIEIAREDASKLAKAESLAKRGGADNLVEAIKIATSIGVNSYIYQEARNLIPDLGRQMMELAQAALARRDADEAINIANRIPASTGLRAEAQDFTTLASARASAWMGQISDIETAIATAQKIATDRPLYNEAQELIAQWQLEIEAVARLDRARQLAQGGTIGDFAAAITEAQLISDSNPRAAEARREINRWRGQVETIEDRPYLNRAEDLAAGGDIASLQAAINEASQISSGRALYSEARSRIRTWTNTIQRTQDQPILDEARFLARNGNLPAAIATAQRIALGRALSGEAQAAVNDWQGQIRARQNWQEARRTALQGTPEALAQAIRLANRVPQTSPLRADVNPAIAQWSQQMFNLALNRGQYDIPGGIAIARRIPPGTDAYRAAQQQITAWEKFLNPEPVVVPTILTPTPASTPQQ